MSYKKILARTAALAVAAATFGTTALGASAAGLTLEKHFDAPYYASIYADVNGTFGTSKAALYAHYMTYGLSEGRKAVPWLDVAAYRAKYTDLQQAFGDDWNAYLNHYVEYGVYEGRRSGMEFDAKAYADRYEDLKAAFGYDVLALYEHYLTYGKAEGRNASYVPEVVYVSWDDDSDDGNEEDSVKLESYEIVSVEAIGDDGNVPENTFDGDYETRWSYEGKGSWITWDLGEVKNVGYMGIAFWKGDERISSFDIYASVDGETFFEIATGLSGELSLDMMGVDFGGTDVRYIKFVGNGNTSNMWNSILEVGFYPVHESGDMVLPKREEEETAEVPETILAAIADLKTVYSDDVLEFLAGLYDPETGAFYYAESSRNNAGFLPDLESTEQVIRLLDTFAAAGKASADYMTAEMREKLVKWTQSLQDEGDGYFYHPQWGKDITETRRGRDLTWAITILTKLHAELLYPTALDRLSDTGTSAAESTNSLPSHLQSEEAFRTWINGLPWKTNPYSAGNSVNAIAAQINAAGLTDVAVECLDALQNPETGLWGDGVNYNTVSAAMKVATVYLNAKRNIHYLETALDSIITMALSDEAPNQITYIYNPWSTISSLRKVIQKSGDEETLQWFTETLYENAPQMIEKTKEKLVAFKKEDGGFSYYVDKGSSTSQGASVSLGLAEGDVNATTIALNSLMQSLYNGLGIKFEAMYGEDDLIYFMECVQNVEPPVKDENIGKNEFDFEDGMPVEIVTNLTNGKVEVIIDPTDETNHVLAFTTAAGAGEAVMIDLPDSEEGKTVEISFRVMFKDFSNGQFTTIGLGKGLGTANTTYQMVTYMYNNKLRFGDRRWSANPAQDLKFFKEGNSLDTWYTFKVVYTPPTDDTDVNIKVSVDGTLVSESNRFYYKNAAMEGSAYKYIGSLEFASLKSAAGTIYIDDVSMKVE